jgi:hypothetical protein
LQAQGFDGSDALGHRSRQPESEVIGLLVSLGLGLKSANHGLTVNRWWKR